MTKQQKADNNHSNSSKINHSNNNNSNNKELLKKIWIIATGTRGDVQPYAAVGAALVKRGYEVVFLTHGKPSLLALAEGYGMRAVALTPDVDYKEYPKFMKAMYESDTKMIFESLGDINKEHAKLYCQGFLHEMETNGLPDLCLAMPLSLYITWYLAIHHQVPFYEVVTYVPYYDPNRPSFGFPNFPFGLNYYIVNYFFPCLSYNSYQMYDDLVEKPILKTYTRWHLVDYYNNPQCRLMVLLSPSIRSALSPSLQQEHPRHEYVGTTVFESNQQLLNEGAFGGLEVRNKIQAFIDQGPTKPIYIGWGSMLCKSPEYMVTMVAKAVFAAKKRAIVFGGGAGELQNLSFATLEAAAASSSNNKDVVAEPEAVEYARTNLLFVGRVPHEWLFPLVAATVHHGGAGTTTAALRGGIPTIITPLVGDQFDFSHAIHQLGVGIGFQTPLGKLTWQELGSAIDRVVNDKEMACRAAKLGESLRAENGTARAVDVVEDYWKEYCVTGKFAEIFPGTSTTLSKLSTLQKTASALAVVVVGAVAVGAVAIGSYWRQNTTR